VFPPLPLPRAVIRLFWATAVRLPSPCLSPLPLLFHCKILCPSVFTPLWTLFFPCVTTRFFPVLPPRFGAGLMILFFFFFLVQRPKKVLLSVFGSPGNLSFLPDAAILLADWGSIKCFPPSPGSQSEPSSPPFVPLLLIPPATQVAPSFPSSSLFGEGALW